MIEGFEEQRKKFEASIAGRRRKPANMSEAFAVPTVKEKLEDAIFAAYHVLGNADNDVAVHPNETGGFDITLTEDSSHSPTVKLVDIPKEF